MTGWSAHSRALGFLSPVSPDARGVNFNATSEKQPDQGTNGSSPSKMPTVTAVSPTAASVGNSGRNPAYNIGESVTVHN